MLLDELSYRANVNIFRHEYQHIIVYEDHRFLLNVLYTLKCMGDLTRPMNLIYFDYHDDALKPSKKNIKTSKKFRKQLPLMPEFWRFTEFDLGANDDDWLLTGMELGFINDAVLIGSVENQNISNIKSGYKDHLNNTHHVYPISHLWHSLDSRGTLGDTFIKDSSYCAVRKITGFNTPGHSNSFTRQVENPFVLDFDCDAFSTEIVEETKAWPSERMCELFNKVIQGVEMSSTFFLKNLIKRASVITICRESGCCGGINESNSILKNIDDLFFNGSICK